MTKQTRDHSAAASAAGYLFQCRYALLLALSHAYRNPALELYIERFDDIAFGSSGEPLELIQTKHHISRQGSLTDTSADLWKTLGIWSEGVAKDGSLARWVGYLLVTTSRAVEGSVAALLRPTPGRDEALATRRLRDIALKAGSVANSAAYRAFLALSDLEQSVLVRSITILDGTADLAASESRIRDAVRMVAPKDKVDALADRLEGWWWGRVCRALSRADDKVITIAEIEDKIDELREAFQRHALPVDMADAEPSPEERVSYDLQPFVRQLQLVGIGTLRIEYAKRDYYRAFEQRSRWSRERLLFDGEVSAYECRLCEEWEVRYAAMNEELDGCCDELRLAEAGRGLVEWVEQVARFPLRSVMERFLTVGSYHMLSDRLRVGWHRDYPARLSSTQPKDAGG